VQFHRDISESINIISAFGVAGIRVADRVFMPPCVITPSTLIENWTSNGIAQLSSDDLQPVMELQPELIILGSGGTLSFPSPDVTKAVNSLGIGFEVMDTAAACRTYNVLAHEGRSLAVALLK